MHRHLAKIELIEMNGAAVKRDEADHHIKARGLARTVRPQQAHDFAAVDGNRNILHHCPGLVAFL